MSETPDQAKRRRRWITLAEFVAVAGLVFTALTFWFGWSDRRAAEAGRHEAEAAARHARAQLVLTGVVEEGGRALRLDAGTRELADVAIRFPAALGVAPQSPADATLRAEWIEPALLRLTDGGPDARVGQVPVLVTTRFFDGDRAHRDTALYDLVWRTHGRIGRARAFALDGWHLRQPHADAAALERAWARQKW